MPSVIELLDGIDLTQLTAKLQAAKLTVSADGSVELRGLDPRDLLGELGAILKSPDAFGISPELVTKSAADGLKKLDALVQLPNVPVLGEVGSALERLLTLLEDAVSKLGAGSGGVDIDGLFPESAGGLDKLFDQLIGSAFDTIQPQIPPELTSALSALTSLAGAGPANGRDLAQALASILFGLNLADLSAAADKIGGFIGEIDAAGGDLKPIDAEIRRLTTAIRGVVALLDAPAVDVPAVQVGISQIRGDFGLLIHNTLPGAAATLTADLDALDVDTLASDLRARITPLLSATRPMPFDLDEQLMGPMRTFGNTVDTLTPQMLDELFQSVEAQLTGIGEGFGVDLLPRAVDELFDVVIDTMREIPVRRMRAELIDELNAIEARIRGFEGFQAPAAIGEKAQEFASKIDGIDTSALQQQVQAFTGKLQSAVDAFPIEDVKQEIQGLSQAVADAIGSFSQELGALSEQVDALAGKLEGLDFSQAGDASVQLIVDIRQKVEDVVSSDDVPDAAKAAIGVAAIALKKVDFSIEISKPFNEAIEGIDVSVVTAPLEGVTGRVRETLQKVTPQAVIDELEKPYEDLLKELQRLRPDAILAAVSQEFQRLVSAIDQLKPENLVAPLDAEFKKITGAIRKAIDPAPLFAPLKALYQKLLSLVELLDLEKILGRILGKTANIPQLLGQKMQGHLTGTDVPNTDATGELFQWGDFLRPLAAIIMQLRSKVQKIAGTVLHEAFAALQGPLRVLAGLAATAGSIASRAADAVDARYRVINLFASNGAGDELRVALNELQAAVASAAVSGQAAVEINGHVAAMRVDLQAHASLDLGAQATARRGALGARLNSPDLGHAVRSLGSRFQSLVPEALLSGDPAASVAASIAAIFDTVDFTALADELDAIGAKVRNKLEAFAKQIAKALIRLWNHIYEAVLPITPFGMLARIQDGMKRVRAEFTVLDPAVLEKEVRDLGDALVDGLDAFSPAALAAQLNGVFDSLKQKVQALDPATLLGDLSAINDVLDQFDDLRPSVVLAPIADSTKDLEASLDAILAVDFGASLEAAVAKLRAQLEAVVADVEAEFQGLLTFMESQGGGSVSVGLSI
ncbi:MAG TPA: hypothetical protein VGJ78_03345 [Vicinamibacterales bacterium]|jgi:hypothetical protein